MKIPILAFLMLALVGCGGEESNQPPQTPPARLESTGIVANGQTAGVQTILAKGAAGVRAGQHGRRRQVHDQHERT